MIREERIENLEKELESRKAQNQAMANNIKLLIEKFKNQESTIKSLEIKVAALELLLKTNPKEKTTEDYIDMFKDIVSGRKK